MLSEDQVQEIRTHGANMAGDARKAAIDIDALIADRAELQRRLEQRAQDVIGLQVGRGELLARLERAEAVVEAAAAVSPLEWPGSDQDDCLWCGVLGVQEHAGDCLWQALREAVAAYQEANDAGE